MSSGFTIIAWIKDDSELCVNLHDDALERMHIRLLTDFKILLGVRWTMDININKMDGVYYAFGCNPRFTVSDKTLRNALGDLTQHVDFIRGHTNSTCEELVQYKQCREKWSVPETVTENTYGWAEQAQGETSATSKRRRY